MILRYFLSALALASSVANLGILSQDLGIFLGHWDFLGIFILRIRPWDFSWDFSEFRENNFKYKFLNSY